MLSIFYDNLTSQTIFNPTLSYNARYLQKQEVCLPDKTPDEDNLIKPA